MFPSFKVHLSICERIDRINNNGKSKHLEGGRSRYACDQPRTLLSRNVLQICAVYQISQFKCLESGVFLEIVEKNLCKLKIFRRSLVCGALLQVFQALGHDHHHLVIIIIIIITWVMSSLNSLHWVMPSRRFRPENFKFCKTSRLIWCVHHFDAISFNWCVVNCLSCLLRASPWQ